MHQDNNIYCILPILEKRPVSVVPLLIISILGSSWRTNVQGQTTESSDVLTATICWKGNAKYAPTALC